MIVVSLVNKKRNWAPPSKCHPNIFDPTILSAFKVPTLYNKYDAYDACPPPFQIYSVIIFQRSKFPQIQLVFKK